VELAELPTLPKATLIEEWDRIVTDPRLRLAGVEEQVAGPAAGELFLGEYRLLTTGGSTGMRGIFVNDRRDFQLTMAGMLRTVVECGIRPETRVASIGSPSPLHVSNQVFAAIRSGRGDSPPLAVTQPIDEIVNGLEAYRPEAIVTYPSILRLLAEEQLDGRLTIAPSIAATGSEVLSDEVRARAREAWGLEVIDVYGPAVRPCRAHRRAKRRHHQIAGGGGRRDRRPPVPRAGALLVPARGAPVPGRAHRRRAASPRRAATERRPVGHGPGEVSPRRGAHVGGGSRADHRGRAGRLDSALRRRREADARQVDAADRHDRGLAAAAPR
jgi:hypothetical protein